MIDYDNILDDDLIIVIVYPSPYLFFNHPGLPQQIILPPDIMPILSPR